MKTTFDEPTGDEPRKGYAPAFWINGSATANVDFTTPTVARTGEPYDPTIRLGQMNEALAKYLKEIGEL
jgi:hypothetical protein